MEEILLLKYLFCGYNFKNIKNGREDYDCWLRSLKHTNSVYVNDICFYYDVRNGYGRNY